MFSKKLFLHKKEDEFQILIGALILGVVIYFKNFSIINETVEKSFNSSFTSEEYGKFILNFKNAKYVTDMYPNVSHTVVSKPLILEEVHPIYTVGEIGDDATIPTPDQVKKFAKEAVAELVVMKNVFITNEGIIIKNNTFYPGDCACHWQQCNNFRGNNFRTSWQVYSREECIFVTHEYGWFFAHLIVDFLPRLLIIPDEIKKRAPVIVTATLGLEDAFELVGIPRNNIVILYPNDVFQVETLYTVAPIECTKFQGFLLMNLRKTLAKKLKLDQAKPTSYIIYNRENAQFRVIENFKDVVGSIKKKYPYIHWKNINIPHKIAAQFKAFNDFRIFIAIHGAAFSNTLFMQPGTCCCEVQVDRFVDNYLWLSMYANVYHIISRDKKIQWRSGNSKSTIDADMMISLATKALELVGDLRKDTTN